MSEKKYRLSRFNHRPKHVLAYRCPTPNCKGILGADPNSIFTRGKELWDCSSCGKTFVLSFRELEEVSK